ncbi:MAG: DUF192 domain-containing protein [Myxococcales bacterium]|nr:DUF192 domain-containing protein [Myxococcales bacterium]
MFSVNLAVALLSAAGIGCSHGSPPSPPAARVRQPAVLLTPERGAEVRVMVEVARTREQQARGMMFRDRIAPGTGMVFLFDHPQQLSFWMHNCYIPLDMIFIRSDLRVLGVVERAEPMTDDSRAVPGDSQYVLEVAGGFAVAHQIGPGTRVQFLDIE